jgi:Spy/CpxP family protein refolding chaperone
MKNFVRNVLTATTLTLGSLALGACASSAAAEGTQTQTAQSAITTGPVAPNAHGPLKLIGQALGQVGLTPAQRTELEQMATAAEARHEPVRAARAALVETIASEVEAGSLDRAALQPKIDAAADAWLNVRTADRAAIDRVHAILTADQRASFVDALHDEMKEMHRGHEGRERLHALASELGLTDAQKDQIKAVLRGEFTGHDGARREEMREHHARAKELAEAFKGNDFAIDKVAPPVDVRAKSNEIAGHVLGIAEKILPILTPDQRKIAAAKLRAHAEMLDPDGGL